MSETDRATSNKMRAVRQAGTGPEIAVRAVLDYLGFEFETNVGDKPGRPDLWVLSEGIAIFVHGCFWHRHEGCTKATTPKRNRDFWLAKFERNQERDLRKVRELEAMGHPSITVWQCETTDESALKEIVLERVKGARRQEEG